MEPAFQSGRDPYRLPYQREGGLDGDVYIYGRTSCFNQDLLSFYEEWLKSVRAEQMENGGIQNTVPLIRNYIQQIGGGRPGGRCDRRTPWQLYQIYGDRSVLEEIMTR